MGKRKGMDPRKGWQKGVGFMGLERGSETLIIH